MTLPIDLVLVRHGESEGNLAKRRHEKGDPSLYTNAFLQRHTASWRLVQKGRVQARLAGGWINAYLGKFDCYYTSEYARAMETAGLLELPGAEWLCDFYITERDWGDLDKICPEEREQRFGEAIARRDTEPFFWSPPNGESFKDLCLRVDRFLDTLHRGCFDKRVIVVCHGEVMWAFRVRLERMSQVRFRELHLSKDPLDRIHNCQIIHYTRRDPDTLKLAPYANWMRMIRPTDKPVVDMGWQQIVRPRYSNEDLLGVVSTIESMVS